MSTAQIIAIAQAVASLTQALAEIAATRRTTMSIQEQDELDTALDKIHDASLAMGAELDAAAAAAAGDN